MPKLCYTCIHGGENMAYSELIKNFEKIREYMREFYVYGFKSRDEYDRKSARSYDNEKRRIESYMNGYMSFHRDEKGKNVFLSIDSRSSGRNPLYAVFKSKSFTDKDITLHFILFDILYDPKIRLGISEIIEAMDSRYLSGFDSPMEFDESTVRKKLKEYESLGLVTSQKDGKKTLYSRSESHNLAPFSDMLTFFSEAGLCGVVGSFLLDKLDCTEDCFCFKHHYITHALESEILFQLFDAIGERKKVTVTNSPRRFDGQKKEEILPLKIFISVQNGRRYLAAYSFPYGIFKMYRLDYLSGLQKGEVYRGFDEIRNRFDAIEKNMWGVTLRNTAHTEHVEFTVHIGKNEEYIVRRLEREKRIGMVERLSKNTCRFSADVYDPGELTPWIRTFIGRIENLACSDPLFVNRFRTDLTDLYRLYGIGGDGDDL